MQFVEVGEENIAQAGKIHSESWKASHKGFCSGESVERHTPAAQAEYLRGERAAGKSLFMLIAKAPVGVVSVYQNQIENLYVLPEEQNKGYGAQLLEYAVRKCAGEPVLWVLNINEGAHRFYKKHGFQESGKKKPLNASLFELEMVQIR